MLLRLTSVLLVSTMVLACSSDDPASGSPAKGSGAAAADAVVVSNTCASMCGRDTRCGSASDPASPNCAANCSSDFSKPEVYRADALLAMGHCFDQLQCGGGDDSCTTQAILAATADPLGDSRYQSCRSRFESCDASAPGSFSDDICSWRLILTDAVQAPLDACLALACSAVNDCVDTLLGQN